jgi:death-on-curing protein
VHQLQLGEHGGAGGIRDAGTLESALARPCTKPTMAGPTSPTSPRLARNHPFIDGNKRTAFVAAELFLALNGHDLTADDVSCVRTMLALASGELGEPEYAAWLRAHLRRRAARP